MSSGSRTLLRDALASGDIWIEIDDVDLEEFKDEIDSWVIEALKGIGCDTARNVLELKKEELLRRTDLEEETVDEVLRILAAEFEEEEGQ